MLAAAAAAKSLQSCLTLCDPIDGSPPGFPVPGILHARTLVSQCKWQKCLAGIQLSHLLALKPHLSNIPKFLLKFTQGISVFANVNHSLFLQFEDGIF